MKTELGKLKSHKIGKWKFPVSCNSPLTKSARAGGVIPPTETVCNNDEVAPPAALGQVAATYPLAYRSVVRKDKVVLHGRAFHRLRKPVHDTSRLPISQKFHLRSTSGSSELFCFPNFNFRPKVYHSTYPKPSGLLLTNVRKNTDRRTGSPGPIIDKPVAFRYNAAHHVVVLSAIYKNVWV
jgi:hypothetical protein